MKQKPINNRNDKAAAELLKTLNEKSNAPVKPNKTVRSIFYNKFLNWLESNDCLRILTGLTKFLIFWALVYYFLNPEKTLTLINQTVEYKNYFLIKTFLAFILILRLEKILNGLINIFNTQALIKAKKLTKRTIKTEPVNPSGVSTLVFDVPVENLLNQLFNQGTFKIKDAVGLGMTKRNAEKLNHKLKTVGVITKDAENNNSFVVSDKYDVETVAEILLDNSSPEKIKNRLEKEKIIITENESPAPGFQINSIA